MLKKVFFQAIVTYTDSTMIENETSKPLSGAQKAKLIGLPGLGYVSEKTGIPTRTLFDWSTTKPKALNALIIGVFFMDNVDKYIHFFKSVGEDHE